MRTDNFTTAPRFLNPNPRLPQQLDVDDVVYSVTFRLHDSLPAPALAELAAHRQRLAEATSETDRAELDRQYGRILEGHLHANHGSCLLCSHGGIVATALRFFHGKRYRLHAWCVMPNHVHAAVHVQRGSDLPLIVHSWKSYSEHRIARGPIWGSDHIARVLRTPADYLGTLAEIRGNPARAALRNWPWIG